MNSIFYRAVQCYVSFTIACPFVTSNFSADLVARFNAGSQFVAKCGCSEASTCRMQLLSQSLHYVHTQRSHSIIELALTFLKSFDRSRDTEVDALLSSAILVVMAYSHLYSMLHVVCLPKA